MKNKKLKKQTLRWFSINGINVRALNQKNALRKVRAIEDRMIDKQIKQYENERNSNYYY